MADFKVLKEMIVYVFLVVSNSFIIGLLYLPILAYMVHPGLTIVYFFVLFGYAIFKKKNNYIDQMFERISTKKYELIDEFLDSNTLENEVETMPNECTISELKIMEEEMKKKICFMTVENPKNCLGSVCTSFEGDLWRGTVKCRAMSTTHTTTSVCNGNDWPGII